MTNNKVSDTQQKLLLDALIRNDFKSFVIKVFNEVSANNTFMDNWHINIICDALMDMIEGDNNRLIINIAPRYMKSIICSVALPAFILGHNPKASIICVSYSDELSSKFALDTKRVIESSWYRDLFPGTRIAKDKKAINDFSTTRGGSRLATSVQGTLTGRGADYIIIDDPIKPADAFSDKVREKTNEWYGHTLYSRLNNKNTGKIVVIMQRIHEQDFTGYLLDSKQNFKLLRIPAIAEEDEIWEVKDRLKNKSYKILRKKGEPLHKERESLNALLEIKNSIGEFPFAGQYQQHPMPIEGGLIKKEWLHYYSDQDSIKFNQIVMSWDTANKAGENNAYSVCLTFAVDKKKNYWLLDCYRQKLDFPDLIKVVSKKYFDTKHKNQCAVKVMIEDHASGTQLIQTLKADYNIFAIGIKPEHDKETRVKSISNLLENGTCKFPDNNPPWWMDFEIELLRFPNSTHKDQCDALSQALLYRDDLKKGNAPYISKSGIHAKNGHYHGGSQRKPHEQRNPKNTRQRR